ncbi:uncharacterized protein N7511_002040 [Penicillium nucicola]|uniref:uncharacterized protein n=1 Tax=Penicillium nucicola TaxID=1850975 RepID=UPI002544F5DD|nr:uncharacterized protein N7511_002040 [Penicillium nucicola]KAJ5769989.1 hypothetical protein N7511_002040 [Penicillium nucicola]
MSDARLDRLARYFGSVVYGKQEVQDLSNFKRFVEAILAQSDPCTSVERVIASGNALKALRNGISFNITPEFINQYTAKFILYLNHRESLEHCGTHSWRHFRARKLEDHAIFALCWTMSELLALPNSSGVDVRADAQLMLSDDSIFSSPLLEIRKLGHKIKHLLEMKSSPQTTFDSEHTVGGRHDNDFAGFSSIAILPTADEIGCPEKPFYRQAEILTQITGTQRIAGHIDNQFRLLREDILSGLRDDFQIAQGTKKGNGQPFA